MELPLYLRDSYCSTFTASISAVLSQHEVVLTDTAFYPQGGGQPSDLGSITLLDDALLPLVTFAVVGVKKQNGMIVHDLAFQQPAQHLASSLALQEGMRVQGTLDWERRYKLMRMHTASHILSYVFYKEQGVLITGNQLGPDVSREDFSLETFDREMIQTLIDKANALLRQDLPVHISFMERQKALAIPGMVKLANALPPEVTMLRIVDIGGLDVQADGGTHVKSTKECGMIELVKLENKGKTNRRLYFSLTPP
ncbi:MAG: alanyl-tRNA editing protein [Candidatus Woesearchaeota archaeon]